MGVLEPRPIAGRPSGRALSSAGLSRLVWGAEKRQVHGFTLIELMITLAVALVLIMVAVPSFQGITLSNKLTTTANDVVNAIHAARMEAIKRNASTQLCSNSASSNTTDALGSACGTQAGAVYALNGVTVTPVLAGTLGQAPSLRLNGDMKALRFTGQGLGKAIGGSTPYTGQVVDICTSQMSSNNHRVITMTAGSILEITTSTGNCPS